MNDEPRFKLEQQIRMVLGFCVLLGGILGLVLHPNWSWISVFMGVSLILTGITGTCGTRAILRRMPWNRS